MASRALAWLYRKRIGVRTFVWGVLGAGIAINVITSDGISVDRIRLLALIFALIVVAVEVAILLGKPRDSVIFSPSQVELLRGVSVPPFAQLIDEADEVLVLGGTLKTFTDDDTTLQALRRFYADNPNRLQILLMHPQGGGIDSTARARQARKKNVTTRDLIMEIDHSLKRLVDALGPEVLRSVYLYREHPTYSMYKFGQAWILTVYTLGRGASSPAMFFHEAETSSGFCAGLVRGFREVRDAATTEPCERLPRDSKGAPILDLDPPGTPASGTQ